MSKVPPIERPNLSLAWAKTNITARLEPLIEPPKDVRIYTNERVMQLMAGVLHFEPTRKFGGLFALGLWGFQTDLMIDMGSHSTP
jgi:hypothetical protein